MPKQKSTQLYTHIIEALKEGCFLQAAKFLFERAKIGYPKIDSEQYDEKECAKAFWIGLTYDKFEESIDSEIVFYCTGLYSDYFVLGAEARRQKFFVESNYKGKRSDLGSLSVNNRDLPKNKLKSKAKDLYKTEDARLNSLIQHFMDKPEKVSFFKYVCIKYTMIIPGKRTRIAITLKSKYANKIFFVNRIENLIFCGREDILNKIKENFDNDNSPCIQLLYGLGGVGKTQIALKYAFLNRDKYNTVVWINATDISKLIDDCKTFLKENDKDSDVNTLDDYDSVLIAFNRFINSRANYLLIIDNADYLDQDNENAVIAKNALTKLISANTGRVLITTRCNSEFHGIKRIKIDLFNPSLALEYLELKTGLKRNAYAKQLAEKLGYLPLALDYVGAYIATRRITYKDYLTLWDKYGTELFDKKGYSEKTIRQAFHITLDKILDNTDESAVALDLLMICAQQKLDYLPIKSYLDLVEEDHRHKVNCFREWLKTGQYLDTFYFPAPDSKDGKFYQYRLVEIIDDDTIKYECLSEPCKGQTIIQRTNKTTKLLSDELTRGEIIRMLSEYSLISWNGDVIIVHPMLMEIIFDEFVNRDRLFDDSYLFFSYNATLYHRFGNTRLALKYEYKALCKALDSFERNIRITESIIKKYGGIDKVAEPIVWFTDVFQRILKYGDDTLIKRAIEYLFSFTKLLYDIDDIAHCKETVLRYEKDFFNQLSWQLGCPIIWKRYPTPSECKQLRVDSICEATEIEDYNNAPHLESAKAAIDIWCYAKSDINKIKDNSNWRIAAIRI